MMQKIENVTLMVVTERNEVLNKFDAKVERISSSEFVATEKVKKVYAANPRVYESDTLSLTLDKDGSARVYVKKFDPQRAADFLASLYEDLKSAIEALKQKEVQ
ncbi:MAG: hypothetical protein J6V54_10975 [Bacteroidales bacterium]|nr:hypothetical protein [Bacteroidales bacterium]